MVTEYKETPKQTPEEFTAIATTLQAAHIVVGHSIVADITTDYGGKLIRLDIHLAEDKPEALMINNGGWGCGCGWELERVCSGKF